MPSSDFVRRLPSPMRPGLVITIDGFIPPHAKRFSINLSTTSTLLEGDIALHANPRFDENNVLVRNSYEKEKWMVEERIGSTLSLQKNANLKCTITGFSDKFQVDFNGQKYEFRHRIPQDRVNWLIVCDDVQVRNVNFGSSQPADPVQICEGTAKIDSPKASVSITYINSSTVNGKTGSSDFVRRLPGTMQPGLVITIDGFIPPHAKGFAINLSTTPNYLGGDIALHANPRFDEANVLVRNSYEKGKWMVEERIGSTLSLQKNANFKCTITGLYIKFQVDFNGQKYEFSHRFPQDRVNWLILNGDVQVRNVDFSYQPRV